MMERANRIRAKRRECQELRRSCGKSQFNRKVEINARSVRLSAALVNSADLEGSVRHGGRLSGKVMEDLDSDHRRTLELAGWKN